MESHGSLWRLVEKDDLAGGAVKVALQTSEIGEASLFLSQSLSLVTGFDKAAMWEVVILEAAPAPAALRVQFKLVELDGGGLDPRFLVCATTPKGQKALAVLSDEQMQQRGDCLWETCWDILSEANNGQMAGAPFDDPEFKSFVTE